MKKLYILHVFYIRNSIYTETAISFTDLETANKYLYELQNIERFKNNIKMWWINELEVKR